MSTETGKRVRKQTQIFNVAVEEKKVVEGGEGTGITLGDYPYFLEQLENFTGADEVLKGLHLFLFGRGKKMEIKKHLKTFNGFPEDTDLDERIQHIVERKKNWTVAVLKDALGLFGLEKGGDREHLIERLVKYLAKPEVLKSVNNGAKKATTTKATTGTKRKAATKKEKGGPKKKRAPSAFILFTTAHRAEVKKQNPEASFGDLSRMVSELWKSASDKEKAVSSSFCVTNAYFDCFFDVW